MIRIVLADDHHIVRQGVSGLLATEPDFDLVATLEDGTEVLQTIETMRPDVLVLDLQMPGLNGLDVMRQLTDKRLPLAIVVFSMHDNESYVADALRLGAAAYVLKSSPATELIEAIHAALAGSRFLSPPLAQRDPELYLQPGPTRQELFDSLTRRERQILQLIAAGHTNAAIGDQLELSRRTVESHRANLMRKLEVESQAALLRLYHEFTQLSETP